MNEIRFYQGERFCPKINKIVDYFGGTQIIRDGNSDLILTTTDVSPIGGICFECLEIYKCFKQS